MWRCDKFLFKFQIVKACWMLDDLIIVMRIIFVKYNNLLIWVTFNQIRQIFSLNEDKIHNNILLKIGEFFEVFFIINIYHLIFHVSLYCKPKYLNKILEEKIEDKRSSLLRFKSKYLSELADGDQEYNYSISRKQPKNF